MEEGNGENLNFQPDQRPQPGQEQPQQVQEPATQEPVSAELSPAMDLVGKSITRSFPLFLKAVVVSIIPLAATFVSIFVASFAFLFLKTKYGLGPITFLPLIIMIFPTIYFSAWQYSAIMAIAVHPDPENAGKKELFENGWDMAAPFMVLSVWSLLIISGGALCLLIPAVIFIGWFTLAGYVLFCENLKGLTALARSRQLVKNYWRPVMWRVAILFAIFFVISLILGMLGKSMPALKHFFYVIEQGFKVRVFWVCCA